MTKPLASPKWEGQTLTADREAILAGLREKQKQIEPKYFYDQTGSELFEAITKLPEYYLTRAEIEILNEHAAGIAAAAGPAVCVIEFGTGSSRKIRLLLRLLHKPVAYVPVEIAPDMLFATAQTVRREFPEILVRPVRADFTQPFLLPPIDRPIARRVVYFPGSTLGNFLPHAAQDLLRGMRRQAGRDGKLLIGIDLRKDPKILEAAYNDQAGVTARFNLNLLTRLNRELGANFDLAGFMHRAFYNETAGRIEMHLVSLRAQLVQFPDATIEFADGETILSEYSHKYDDASFAQLIAPAGLAIADSWSDARDWFRLYCLTAAPAAQTPAARTIPGRRNISPSPA